MAEPTFIFDTLSAEQQKQARELADKEGWLLDTAAIAVKSGPNSIRAIKDQIVYKKTGTDPAVIRNGKIEELKHLHEQARQNGRMQDAILYKNRLHREFDVKV